jgi:hypothetical protein
MTSLIDLHDYSGSFSYSNSPPFPAHFSEEEKEDEKECFHGRKQIGARDEECKSETLVT